MAYLQRCTYVEVVDPEKGHCYDFTGPCMVTGEPYTVRIPGKELFAYNQGRHVQDAMPSLNAGDREFVISGTSPAGWEQLFGGMDEDDELETADAEAPEAS